MDAVEVNTSEPPENEEGMVSDVEICRVCLLGNLVMRDLFQENDVASLSAKAMSFASVKMLPGDGLPSQVCCVCAQKLESAYEFKLQVEQADGVLRERYDSLNIKEELFFNEVEVQVDARFQTSSESLDEEIDDEKRTLLKDHMALLQVEKLAEEETGLEEEQGDVQEIQEEVDQDTIQEDHEVIDEEIIQQDDDQTHEITNTLEAHEQIKDEGTVVVNTMAVEEHDYIVQQDYTLQSDREYTTQETPSENQDSEQFIELLNEEHIPKDDMMNQEEQCNTMKAECPSERSLSKTETRRSKRRSLRRAAMADRVSDEENYFENLNLSSRLKRAQADKSEKVFFMCYLCDKQFLSKGVLKEHMHSHEEVRRALSLKKTHEKPQRGSTGTAKIPPSGKRANKCPHCGKEYLYVISFNKHLKQHEKDKVQTKKEHMPLEVSFEEDENSLNFSNCNRAPSSNSGDDRDMREDEEYLEDDNQHENEDQEDRRKRKRKNHIQSYSCNKCPEKFYTKRGLRKHDIRHIPLTCSVCNEEYDSLEKLRHHRTNHVMEGVLSEQDLKEDVQEIVEKEVEEEDEDDIEEDIEDEVDNEEQFSDTQGKEMHRKRRWNETKDLKCPNCPMTYSHKKSLSRHLETHEGTKYGCKMCCQQFSRKDHLRRHMEQHGRVKSFKCTQCNKTFGNELTLRNHLIATNHKTFVHGQEYDPNKRIKRVAAKAAQKIIDKIKIEDDLEDDEDEDDINDDFDNRGDDYGPTKKHNYRKDFECATCGRKCGSKQSLTKHMEQHVKDEKAEKLEKMKKDKKDLLKNCSSNLGLGIGDFDIDDDENSDFESGLEWPIDNHECTTCKKKYSTKKSLLRHQLLHEEPNFECDICNVKFYRKDKLKAHYDKCSEKNPDQVRKCNICGDSFESNELLREHRTKHVTEGILTEEDLRDIEPRPENRKKGEKIVRKRRTDIVGLECTECNKQYTSRKGLLRHLQVHEGKKYLCDICPKKFYRREHLKIHVAKHNMIKPYKCTRCTKRFTKEEQLTNHLTKHDRNFKKSKDTDSSKRFLCEICSKSFTQSTTLIAHLRAHNGIKPYVCEVCSRPFTTNAYLKMHMRTHTQERPYICQYCSRAFARADTLANHLTSHTGEAKYHCKYCPKNFRRLKSLKEHVFIHTGQRPYACPTCDRRFNNNGSRYAHSKRCKQNLLQNQNRNENLEQVQLQPRIHQTIGQAHIVKPQSVKTITITRPGDTVTTQQVMQHQEILMPLILPLTVTLTDVGEEVILPEGTKIFTTS